MTFKQKTALITGASRGIGKAIALRLAKEGANIAIAAKTVENHPKLEGTIYSAALEIAEAGTGKVEAFQLDIRDDQAVDKVVEQVVKAFGSIDILVNNASAINLSPLEQLEPKRFDLMHDINIRGTYAVSRACLPYLKKSANPHILNLSPPINMDNKWFNGFSAYTISKYGMSMLVIGMAQEWKKYNIAANALWPKTTIATAAIKNIIGGEELINKSRTTQIVADAAFYILKKPSASCSGNFFIDEEVLHEEGITNFDHYAVQPGAALMPDFFL